MRIPHTRETALVTLAPQACGHEAVIDADMTQSWTDCVDADVLCSVFLAQALTVSLDSGA